MSKKTEVKILDCTLRDGGYINNWEFGERAISDIISNLAKAKIDIIECGFLKNVPYNKDSSVFNTIKDIEKMIFKKNEKSMYVAMIKYGDDELDIEQIPDAKGCKVDGIRVIFSKDNIDNAIDYCSKIIQKGYKVFMQPVKISFYDKNTLMNLINKVNALKPYAFYIVDTFGAMQKNELLELFSFIDSNLDGSIRLGFHSHNNLQLSFSNTVALIEADIKREILIDSSVFGMGRGAGNLATELITQFINTEDLNRYEIAPLLNIYDEYLKKIYNKKQWGASLPYFLSATYNCHPDYAAYLAQKNNISAETVNFILQNIPSESRIKYDEEIIQGLYFKSQKAYSI